jgi:hypothetical protein
MDESMMSSVLWWITYGAGWMIWAWTGFWTLTQTRVFISEWPSILTRTDPVRTVILSWIVLLVGLMAGIGRVHLLWIAWWVMYLPPVASAFSVRTGGFAHGVLSYVIGFAALAFAIGPLADDLADAISIHSYLYHLIAFAVGGGIGWFCRRSFWKTLAALETVPNREFG